MKVTVFTPTYNRAYIIEQLYMSLCRQTYLDFEWLVVDDGSTDNTEQLFCNWQQECILFPIRYYKKENGGKCRAINHALDLAEGELFFTVDSDDYLTPDALEKIVMWESRLPDNEKYGGVIANRGSSPKETINYLFEQEFYDGTFLDLYGSLKGEKAIAIYTSIHKQYRYPEYEGEKFMTEAVVWNRMARDGYKMRFYNDIIWVYEYLEDGLTKAGSSMFLNNPRGYGLWLKEKAEAQKISLKQKLMMYYTFTCDLSDRYDNIVISQCIGTSPVLIAIFRVLHKIRRLNV